MPPEALSSLILVAGAVLLGVAAVLVVRQVATKAEDRSRIAVLEAQLPVLDQRSREALEAAAAAKRIASKRKDREERVDARGATPEDGRPGVELLPAAADDFRPGYAGGRPAFLEKRDPAAALADRGLRVVNGAVEAAG